MDTHNMNAYQYRMTQLLEATIEMEAMKVANMECVFSNIPLKYSETAFESLINKHGIHHNAAVEAGREITG